MLEEKTLSVEEIYSGRIFKVEQHTVELPDKTQSKRDIIKHNGAVAILPITKNGEIILVEQYRKAIDEVILEIPAGKLELNEEPISCAIRELEEETGYIVSEKDLVPIYKTHVAVGYSSELIHIYLVEDLDKKQELNLDSDEFLNCKKFKVEEVYELLDKNVITDSKTIIALEWYKNRNRGNKVWKNMMK